MITTSDDDLYRANVQSIRDQLNEHVIKAARLFVRPQVTHELRNGSWYIVIRETATLSHEDVGTGRDPHAAGHERQGRRK